jgi:chemotaxis protein methyltransferase CheR
MLAAITAPTLQASEFDAIRELLYRICGIRLKHGKEELVRSRLLRRLRELELPTFAAYVGLLRGPGGHAELQTLVNHLTTNTTSFFRENHHFELLRSTIIPAWRAARRPVRIWSAGCSTGQEPYTISITLNEAIHDIDVWDIRVLATDISSRVLGKAKAGEYDEESLTGVSEAMRRKYFEPTKDGAKVGPKLRRVIKFAPLNLLGPWPMRGPFQAIFCRNVLIYFERDLQAKLAARYIELLEPGGYLFLGHSEALGAGRQEMRAVGPSVYVRSG